MRPSVCIISPAHVAANPRVVKEADALHSAGYTVTVVAGDQGVFVRRFGDEMISRSPWTVVQVGPPSLMARVVSKAAKQAARAFGHRSTCLPPDLAAVAQNSLSSSLVRAACAIRADLYIAHYVAALPAAAAAARAHGGVLGYDAEDFYAGEQLDNAAGLRESAFVRAIERRLLPQCSHITAASPMIAEAYAELYGTRLLPVLNVFPWSKANDGLFFPHSPLPNELRAYWFSQTIGLDRGLQSFIHAMTGIRAHVTLHIRGGDRWGHGKSLVALARSLGIEDRVELLPIASPTSMIECAAQYDVGLALETGISENRRRCLTNKIFTYLAAGRPILMSDTPAQRALAGDLGSAAALVSLADPASISRQLNRWALAPETLQKAKEAAGYLARTRYNWQVEQKAFLASVARALQHR